MKLHAVRDDVTVVAPVRAWHPAFPRQEADVGQQTLTNRVQVLERKWKASKSCLNVSIHWNCELCNSEMRYRAEFSAIRAELRAEIRGEIERTRAELRAEIRAGDEQTRTDLRAEIRAGDEETRTYMRVLHEEVLSRIALLGEQRNGFPRSRRPSKARQREK